MTQEKDIVYQNGSFWVLKTDKAYEIYEDKATHALRWDVIRTSFPDSRNRAIENCDKRQKEGRA